MARTKQTHRKSAQNNKKRKAPEDDDDSVGLARKKIKCDYSTWSESDSDRGSSNLSASSSSSENDESSSAESFNAEITKALALIESTLQSSNYAASEQYQLADELEIIVKETKSGLQEMNYRKNPISIAIACEDNKIKRFAKRKIKGLRWHEAEEKVEDDIYTTARYMWYSLDIALKTSVPHIKYKKKMRKLLKAHIPEKDVANFVIEYAQTGYKWYRISYRSQNDDNDYGPPLDELNEDGIIHNLKFDPDDFFRDNTFYKAQKPPTGKAVHFRKWRKELDSKYMDCMSDEDLVTFICNIDTAKLGGLLRDDCMEDLIVRVHK